MQKIIPKYLEKIEKEKNVKILLACETGSRAWGFPSPDSDYDVRIIYVHNSDWYLSINDKKDNIDSFFENNEIDISGWELKKCLNLLRKSNSALLERIQSPMVYSSDQEFVSDFINCAKQQYSKIASIHHYLSMAKSIMSEIRCQEEYKLKKFFYALRCASVCKWISEKSQIPPIEFTKVYPQLQLEKDVEQRIIELIEFKKTKSEAYWHKGEDKLLEYIEKSLSDAEAMAKSLPSGNGNIESLNSLLRKYIIKYDH